METGMMLSRREATLRSAATASLAGIALVQAVRLPPLFDEGTQLAVLSIAAMAACLALGLALAAAPADATRQVWRTVAAAAVVVFAGWAATQVFAIPGLTGSRGHWTAMPGAASAALAAACLVLAIVAVPPRRPAARGLATAIAVLLAAGPAAGVLLVALGPGPAAGEAVLAEGGHVHATHSTYENTIKFVPGGRGGTGHYVVPAPSNPHQTRLGVALIVASALIFTYGAAAHLRRRTGPAPSIVFAGIEGSLG